MSSGFRSLMLTSLFVAPLFAGSIDEARSAFNGAITDAYKQTVSLLEKDNTQDGKQAAYKLKEMLNSLNEIFHNSESALEGIDPKLKSQWADLYRLLKDVLVMAGVVHSEVGTTNYKSDLSELKSRWEKLANEFPKVYATLVEYGKTTMKFQSLCGSCR
jgi:hypothetical protein